MSIRATRKPELLPPLVNNEVTLPSLSPAGVVSKLVEIKVLSKF